MDGWRRPPSFALESGGRPCTNHRVDCTMKAIVRPANAGTDGYLKPCAIVYFRFIRRTPARRRAPPG